MSKSGCGNEDIFPEGYPYYWSSDGSNLSIEDFVKKYKPSMVQNDGTKPWLWVQNSNNFGIAEQKKEAVEKATQILVEATARVQEIDGDDNIPTRSNKKTGAKSKKQLKDEVQSQATKELKAVHRQHGYKSGKWLAFVAPDVVDTVWSRIATSVAMGHLSETVVYLAKVATTPTNESSAQRLICIYMPDVLDRLKVMRILLRNHGLNLSGVKSNLYTEIALDSKHPSHLQSTIWKNSDLMKASEIKELKDAFYADLKAEQATTSGNSTIQKLASKPKPVEDDPFASSEDDESGGKEIAKVPLAKRKAQDQTQEDDMRPTKMTR